MNWILKPLIKLIRKDYPLLSHFKIYKKVTELIIFLYYKYLTKNKLLLEEIHGSLMYLDLRTEGISATLFNFKTREQLETDIVKKELKKNSNCLDIGANIGYYCLIEAQIISENNVIHAIEPDRINLMILRKNLKINSYHNVKIFNFAVSNKNGTSFLNL